MTGFEPTSSSFRYDVFINFRGEDTRHGFTGHLYNALKKAGVRTFFDDEEIRRGDEITPTLMEAIENSKMSIIVFSENYASSTFCLKELVKIHECIYMKGRSVFPIFYKVEPSVVRHQQGKYGQALDEHLKIGKADEKMIQSWKQALQDMANKSGFPFIPGQTGYEHKFIEEIVKDISSKIDRVVDPLYVCDNPVGLESRVKEITSLLQIVSNDEKVIMVGICGMGGLGKSTTACALYNSVAAKFEGSCFLSEVKEKYMKVGLERIQEIILSEIVGGKFEIHDVHRGVEKMKGIFKEKKILLILDDVDNHEQLKMLAGRCDWFKGGSRIIITTRDGGLLQSHGVQSIYNMEHFNTEESLELFTRNVFGKNQVDPSYQSLLNRAITYAQGLPLALEIIGANLRGMTSIGEWESALDLYEKVPEKNILKRLKVSYDCLSEEEQNIFLDIACFFNGKHVYDVEYMLEQFYGINLEYVIKILVNKCLLKFDAYFLKMHDLIQDMGRDIIRKESPNKPGEWSRLWVDQDIVDVLEDNTGTDKIRMIIKGSESSKMVVNWDGEGFKHMKGLKVLILENVKFSEGPKYLPNSLKVLSWESYPLSYLPPHFCPKKLVHLDLRGNHLFEPTRLISLESIKKTSSLGSLNLQYCVYVRGIPDLSNLQNLKEIKLQGCSNLIEIHASIGDLRKLEVLDVSECDKLKIFPRALKSPSLTQLSLGGCKSLKYFPEILENVQITLLSISFTGIDKLPWSICNLTKLRQLWISQWELVVEIPSCIFLLPEIKEIIINCKEGKVMIPCNSREAHQQQAIQPNMHDPSMLNTSILMLPRCNISDVLLTTYLSRFINVQHLDLSGNPITMLPTWIKQCHLLETLSLNECKHLREVKGIPPNLQRLEAKNCTSLISDSQNLLLSETTSNLGILNLQYCEYIREIPDLSNVQDLKELKLAGCRNLIEIHVSIGCLRKLEVLNVGFCDKLKMIPRAFKSPSLRQLSLCGCKSLKYFPDILENVEITWLPIIDTGIDKLPWSIYNLTKLKGLYINQWELVVEIPSCIFLLPEIEEISITCKEGKVMIPCVSKDSQQKQAIRSNKHDPSRVFNSILMLPKCNISDVLMTTYLNRFINVQHLDLSDNPITILPTWIKQCHLLETLNLNECKHLREVNGIPPNIQRLEAANCTSLSLNSKTLLLSKELHRDPNRYTFDRYDSNEKDIYFINYFCVPSTSLPEWFEHKSKGASISFWFRESFPPVCLCFLFKPEDGFLHSYDMCCPKFILRVSFNGKKVGHIDMLSLDVNVFDDHHLFVCHVIREDIIDDNEIEDYEWNSNNVDRTSVDYIPDYKKEGHEWIDVHVEVFAYTSVYEDIRYNGVVIEESGMYVIKQLSDMQHISFHNPHESSDSTSSGPGKPMSFFKYRF